MVLHLTRDIFGADFTLGVLLIDGKPFGYTCEDEDRGLDASMPLADIVARKEKADTAIPLGRYRIRRTWSNRYQREVPELLAVPGFRGIRIHSGNTEADTAGCLLPGKGRGDSSVTGSAKYAAWLDREIARREKAEEVWIDIVRDPAAWLKFTTTT